MATSHVYWQSSSCQLPALHVSIHLNLKGNAMKISIPTPKCLIAADRNPCTTDANSWCSSCPHCKWGTEDGGLAGHWEENYFEFILAALECVCTHEPRHRGKASSHPNRKAANRPDHYRRCSSGSLILPLCSLMQIAACSHTNTEVHL